MSAVTPKIARFRAGSESAFADLFALFFTRQVRQAENALGRGRGGLCDGEDVALSAFRSLWREGVTGKFSGRLEDTNGLLGVLQLLTTQKAARAKRYDLKQKRDIRRVVPGAVLPELPEALPAGNAESDPLDDLPISLSERQREIVKLFADGWVRGEIATRLGCALRTVDRELASIRAALGERPGP